MRPLEGGTPCAKGREEPETGRSSPYHNPNNPNAILTILLQPACNRRTEPPENIEPDGDPGPFRSPIAQGLQPASQTIVHFHPTSLLPTQRTQDPGHSRVVHHASICPQSQ